MEKTLNIILWILQAILGIKLLTASFAHGLGWSKPAMQEAISKMGNLAKPFLLTSALGTVLCTLGLILPGLLDLSTRVTSFFAGLTAAMLLGSIFLHTRAREKPKVFVSLVLFTFSVLIAIGRWF